MSGTNESGESALAAAWAWVVAAWRRAWTPVERTPEEEEWDEEHWQIP